MWTSVSAGSMPFGSLHVGISLFWNSFMPWTVQTSCLVHNKKKHSPYPTTVVLSSDTLHTYRVRLEERKHTQTRHRMLARTKVNNANKMQVMSVVSGEMGSQYQGYNINRAYAMSMVEPHCSCMYPGYNYSYTRWMAAISHCPPLPQPQLFMHFLLRPSLHDGYSATMLLSAWVL